MQNKEYTFHKTGFFENQRLRSKSVVLIALFELLLNSIANSNHDTQASTFIMLSFLDAVFLHFSDAIFFSISIHIFFPLKE